MNGREVRRIKWRKFTNESLVTRVTAEGTAGGPPTDRRPTGDRPPTADRRPPTAGGDRGETWEETGTGRPERKTGGGGSAGRLTGES
ncbi:hypothetical protein GCM10010247_23100 [Streptomyces calvus]|nr:hypothetical protein GCM10010247_23100 [Streptomyces calvus]